MMFRPSPRLLRLALVLMLVSALVVTLPLWAPALHQPGLVLWAVLSGALMVALISDTLAVVCQPVPSVRRLLPAAMSVHRDHVVRLQFVSAGLPPLCELADHHPTDDPNTGLPALLVPADGSVTEFVYRYRPTQRGRAHFGDIELWIPGPLGLIWQRRRIEAATSVPVYPDFSMLQPHRVNATQESVADTGQRRQQRRGEGMEFHQLREYRAGDALRQIDWKASARRRTLISREYQEEQNQPIVVLLDGGSRLATHSNGLTAFDHALNATLLLAWSALGQGDKPGVMLFSGDQDCWLPPVRGQQGLHRLLNGLYTVHPGQRASDYSQAARQLLGRWHKHALVVLVTQLQPDDEQELMSTVSLLGKHHLLLIADIQLPAQERLRHQQVVSADDALRITADAAWCEARDALHTRLRHAGAMVVPATPEHLPARLNQLYLTLKRSGRL